MASIQPRLTDEQLAHIYAEQIRPYIFDPDPRPQQHPTLILLGGQPGAGKSRATARLLAQHDEPVIPLTGDDLRMFHPHYLDLVQTNPVAAPTVLAQATAPWVRGCINHARDTRQSLLLEGTFHDPAVTLRTAQQFSDAGYTVRVVIAAASRAESLLAVTSRYLHDRQQGHPARYTSRNAHDRGWDGTAALAARLDVAHQIDRVSIIDRSGNVTYDATRDTDGFRGASAALTEARNATWGARTAVEWLGELRRVTHYARQTGQVDQGTGELLTALHEIALREITPTVPLPKGSRARSELERRLAHNLVGLRRTLAATSTDPAAPITPVPEAEPGLARS